MKKKIYGVLVVIAMTVNVIACGPKESNISSNSEDIAGNEDIDNVPDVTISDEIPTETEENESTGIVVIDDYSDLKIVGGGMEIIPGKTTLQEILDYGEKFGGFELYDFEDENYVDAGDITVGAGVNKKYIYITMASYETREYPDFSLKFVNNTDEELLLKDCVVAPYGEIAVSEGYTTYSEGEDGILGFVINETTYDEIVSDIGEPKNTDMFGNPYWDIVDKNGSKLGTVYLTINENILTNVTIDF